MIDFFADPWNVHLAKWTMFHIVSALIQLSIGYISFMIIVTVITRD